MKRNNYKGYIIDEDNLGRAYIYNTLSPYSESCDKRLLCAADYIGDSAGKDLTTLQAAKRRIDCEIEKRGKNHEIH